MKTITSLLIVAVLTSHKVEGLSILRSHQVQSHHRHSRLFAVPNSGADVNANLKLVSGKPKNKISGRKPAGATSEVKQLLRPHAPKTPRPSTKEDESVLDYANQLLDTQEASKSPTRRIADEDFYQSSPKNHLQTIHTDIAVGPKPYVTSIELLRGSKRRAMKLMSRSNFEKEKAEEKKARIMARMEAELREVENGLKVKLDMALAGIEDDVERMQILINREMILEEERMAQFNLLVQRLQSSALAIQKDMATETKIYHEMEALNRKLDDESTSAKQLCNLIVRKQELLDVESDLLKELETCTSESKQAFYDCERRYKSMQSALDNVCRPARILAGSNYDWSDIDIMETVLAEATEDIEKSQLRLETLRQRMEFALRQKDAILLQSDNVQPSKSKSEGSSVIALSDLQSQNDTDVIRQLAVSLTNATLSGGKATAFALKTLLDAVSAQEVGMAAHIAREKTNQVIFGSNETKEAARAAIDSIVDTTKVFFEKAASSDASIDASVNVQNFTNELLTAANAVSLLGGRAYRKIFDQIKVD